MSAMQMIPIEAIVKAASKVAFLPILFATINYFHNDKKYTGSGIIDMPGPLLLLQYDFIIVGAGSAGEYNIKYYNSFIIIL